MIIAIIWLLLINKKFNASERIYFFSCFFIGVFFLWFNNELIYSISNSYFAGSDATEYYLKALNFDFANLTMQEWLAEVRYVLYIIFQKTAAYPFLSNEKIASLLIKLSNWSIALLSVVYFKMTVRIYSMVSAKNSIYFRAFNILSLVFLCFLSTYNFRDALISASLIFIFSSLITNKITNFITVIGIVSLANLRYFTLPVVMLGYILSKRPRTKLRVRKLGISQELASYSFLLFLIVLIIIGYAHITPIFTYVIQFLTGYSYYDEINHFSPIDYIRSLVAGNPIVYWSSYLTNATADRSFVITGIGAFIIGLNFLISYFLFVYIFSIPIFYFIVKNPNKESTSHFSERLKVFTYVSIFTFLLLAAFYGFFYQGMQERIRIGSYIPVLLAIGLQPLYVKRSSQHIMLSFYMALLIAMIVTVLN